MTEVRRQRTEVRGQISELGSRNEKFGKIIMKKIRKRKERNPKVIIACLLLMFAFIGELLFYTWCRVQYVRIKYEITEQTTRIRKLSAMQDNLKIEMMRLKSPQRIAKIARTQLGLVTPTPQQTVIIP